MAPSPDLLGRLVRRIDSYRQEMVEFQKELTAIVALSPENGGQGEFQRAKFIKEKLSQFGLHHVVAYDSQDSRAPNGFRPNLVIRLEGKVPSPAVWIMAHMDTVPPGELKLWTPIRSRPLFEKGKYLAEE